MITDLAFDDLNLREEAASEFDKGEQGGNPTVNTTYSCSKTEICTMSCCTYAGC